MDSDTPDYQNLCSQLLKNNKNIVKAVYKYYRFAYPGDIPCGCHNGKAYIKGWPLIAQKIYINQLKEYLHELIDKYPMVLLRGINLICEEEILRNYFNENVFKMLDQFSALLSIPQYQPIYSRELVYQFWKKKYRNNITIHRSRSMPDTLVIIWNFYNTGIGIITYDAPLYYISPQIKGDSLHALCINLINKVTCSSCNTL